MPSERFTALVLNVLAHLFAFFLFWLLETTAYSL